MCAILRRLVVLLLYVKASTKADNFAIVAFLPSRNILAIHAAPVHQLQQYYVYGNVDDCTGHWSRLYACLKQKTARYKDDTLGKHALGTHPIWQLRTKTEAEAFWKNEFVREEDSSAAEGSQQRQQTFV